MSWNDIQPMLAKLNKTSKQPGMTCVLPTEAQWEYACRAGSTTAWHFSDDTDTLHDYGWTKTAKSERQLHPVGQLRPNAFGLYDMHGNISEWCADCHAADYYRRSPTDNPAGPSSGRGRVTRGGTRLRGPGYSRSARRHTSSPDRNGVAIGFRLTMTIDVAKLKPAKSPPTSSKRTPSK